MLLKKITLNDFGVYGGHNEFDLVTKQSMPIILFGGTNGAGKTTFFESIMLCLYGHSSIEPKITQKHYQQKIRKLFHRYRGTKKAAEETSIIVEFQYAHQGKITEYRVIRMWHNDEGQIHETLSIMKKNLTDKDFSNLDSIEESQWQTFIDQLLPRGITKLFFFDGEKIQDIASSGNEDMHIRSSFDTLLGLDLVKQLHDDISLYILRNSGGEIKKILDDIDQKTKEKKDIEEKLDSIREKQVFLQAEINTIQKKIDSYEEKFSRLGGQFADKREKLTIKKTKLETILDDTEKKIRDMCAGVLPFSLVPNQLAEIQDIIKKDIQKIEDGFEKNILEKRFNEIIHEIKSDNILLSYDDHTKQNMLKQIQKILQNKINSLSKLQKTIFNLSIDDMKYLIGLIDKINNSSVQEIESLAKKHNELFTSLKLVTESLDIAPQNDEIGVLFSDIIRENRNIGELENELSQLKDVELQEKTMITMLNSKIRQNLAKRKIDKRRMGGLEMAPKVQDTLEEYAQNLRIQKIELLESYILDGIVRFFHKKNFIEKISIDKNTFEVKMYNGDDDEIIKDMLSKGELQMYATAIVWGLAKTSGRPLPFIIDTPLARLDMEHRENLVDNFYPFASHQTIILSTDSEITEAYYKKLKQYMSKTIKVQFDSEQGKTISYNDYFFEKRCENEVQ